MQVPGSRFQVRPPFLTPLTCGPCFERVWGPVAGSLASDRYRAALVQERPPRRDWTAAPVPVSWARPSRGHPSSRLPPRDILGKGCACAWGLRACALARPCPPRLRLSRQSSSTGHVLIGGRVDGHACLVWHGTRRSPHPPLKQEAVSILQPDTDDWSIMTLVAWARESRGRCHAVSAHPETRHSLDGFPNKCGLVHPICSPFTAPRAPMHPANHSR